MSRALDQLLSILDIETLEQNLFRGLSPQVGWQRVFGGQVIGQALVAAHRTVEGRLAHSLHAYFLRAGDPAVPIIYEVDRIRDGGSFSTRRVVAIQHGQAIFSMAASFHKKEEGLHHQVKMPEVPPPESLPSEAELKECLIDRLPEPVKAYWQRERPIEIRPVELISGDPEFSEVFFDDVEVPREQLLGARTPFPWWPEDRHEELAVASVPELCARLLRGESPAAGLDPFAAAAS